MRTVLFICTANQCRSPMASALLAAKVARMGQSNEWAIGSAGTWAEGGYPATSFAQKILAEKNISLKTHRSRVVSAELLEAANVVLVMTQNHLEALRAEFPQFGDKLHVLSELIDQSYDINDPAGGTENDYRLCADDLQQIIERGFSRLVDWTG
jgi:protein-tyrosine-phosphatase